MHVLSADSNVWWLTERNKSLHHKEISLLLKFDYLPFYSSLFFSLKINCLLTSQQSIAKAQKKLVNGISIRQGQCRVSRGLLLCLAEV